MIIRMLTSRRAVWGAAMAVIAAGMSQGISAMAEPSLPIATSGPMKSGGEAPNTVAAQLVAKQVGYAQFTAPDYHVGLTRHLVMFKYKPGVTEAQRQDVAQRFLDLVKEVRRPNGQPVIVSVETGMQNSPEGAAESVDQGFLVTFRSEGDRNYYLGRPVVNDPAYYAEPHDAYKIFSAPFLQDVKVFDYTMSAIATSAPASRKAGRK